MSAITRRIEEAIETGRAKNYSDLAHHLGVTPAAITEWRKERSAPNEDQAAALASLLGKPEVMAECMAARTRRPETRAMWERAAKTLSMATALSRVAGVLVLLTTPGNNANASMTYKGSIDSNTNYRDFIQHIARAIHSAGKVLSRTLGSWRMLIMA